MNPPAGQSPPDMVNVYGLLRSQASQALGALEPASLYAVRPNFAWRLALPRL
jgi:hypothetical protein